MLCSWYSGDTPLLDTDSHTIRHQSVLQDDGTYLTSSYVNMMVTRLHHLMMVRCQATNEVMEANGEPAQEDRYRLSVKYAPVITPVNTKLTTNISSQVSFLPPSSFSPQFKV